MTGFKVGVELTMGWIRFVEKLLNKLVFSSCAQGHTGSSWQKSIKNLKSKELIENQSGAGSNIGSMSIQFWQKIPTNAQLQTWLYYTNYIQTCLYYTTGIYIQTYLYYTIYHLHTELPILHYLNTILPIPNYLYIQTFLYCTNLAFSSRYHFIIVYIYILVNNLC